MCVCVCVAERIMNDTRITENEPSVGPFIITYNSTKSGVIGSDVPWLECPACNALTWVITVTE